MPETNGTTIPRLSVEYLDASAINVPEPLNRWIGSAADKELQESIEKLGLLEAIGVVAEEDGSHELSFGSRRLGAWKDSASLSTQPIPAVVIARSDALRGTFDENSARLQLGPVDKAKLARHALEMSQDKTLSQVEVAKKLGMARTRLTRLQRAWAHPEVWDRVVAGTLPVDSAIEMADLPIGNITAFLRLLEEEHPKASVRDIRGLAREWMGESLTTDLGGPVDGDRASAIPSLVDHVLQHSPVGKKVRVNL